MTKRRLGSLALGVSLFALGCANRPAQTHHTIADPRQPGPDTVVFVEVRAEGKGIVVVEIHSKDLRVERASIRAGETASTVVGFWGQARPIEVTIDGRAVWSGPVTTSLGGPNHLTLTVRDGALARAFPEFDPTIGDSPSLPERQVGHVPFQPVP